MSTRTDMHRLQDLIRLHRHGEGSRLIARQLRMGRDTIRHYLHALHTAGLLDGKPEELPELDVLARALAAELPAKPPPQQVSTLESWRELIAAIRARYEVGAMMVTSNRAIEEWYALFPDDLMASAAMDRLLHHAEVVVLEGQSFRNPSRQAS